MKRVFAHIGFSFAITLIVLNFTEIWVAFVILAVTSAAFSISVLVKKTRKSISVPLCMFSAFLACVIFISNYYVTFIPQKNLDKETVQAEFYIVDLEECKNDRYYYTVKASFIDKNNFPHSIKLTVKSDDKINADYYQKIDGKIKLRLISENGFSSYGSFGNGIFLSGTLLNFDVQEEHVFSLNNFILNQRENIKKLIKDNIKSPESAIIIGILIGDKSEVLSNISESFRYSGVSHIMAVSGLHLAVFCGAVSFLLKKIRMPRKPQAIITFICVLFYMALAGFSKSILRAGIMMIVFLVGKLFNEKSDSLNSLGIAVFLICLNPYAVTDAGALLTVTAVLGLIVINPLIIKWYKPKTTVFSYIYKTFATSASIFITTFPVICLTFGYVSIYGIVLNIVMIPLAQIALIFSFLMILFSAFSPLLFVFSYVCRVSASFMIYIAEKVSSFPYAVADVSDHKYFLAVGAVFVLFGIAFLFNKKAVLKRCVLISLAVFVSILFVSDLFNRNYVYVKGINGYYSTAVVVYDKKNAVVIGIDDSSQYYSVLNMIKSKNLNISMIVDINDSDYSKSLANKLGAVNYVSDNKNAEFLKNCSNFFTDAYFNVDLWQSLNVEYKSNKKNKYVTLKIYNSEFVCIKKFEYLISDDNVIYLDSKSDYDVVYTVSENGLYERRIHEWQK